jgi:nucleoside-diphosphate-sugar epimerase
MKVLVTGTDGFIGALLAPVLLARGHEVVGCDTGFYRDAWLYNHDPRAFPSCLNQDIRQLTAETVKAFDAVVHLAELSNDPLGQLKPEVTYEINHQGSVALAQMCKNAGVTRFVYSSSCSVYGAGTDDVKTEASEPLPQTAYAICKVLVERDVSQMADERFSPTFLRNATAYGPSPRMRFDLVLNNLAGLAWTTGKITMTSDGTPWRPLVHVLDICEAFACVLDAPRKTIHNQIFNVGDSDENYQVRDIAQIIADVFPHCALTFGAPSGDNRSYRVSFDKIKQRLIGFKCQRDATTGAQQLHELFERIQLTPDVLVAPPYTRLKKLQYLMHTQQIDEHFFWRGW